MLLPGDEEDEEPIVDGVVTPASASSGPPGEYAIRALPVLEDERGASSGSPGEYATRSLPELDDVDPEGDCPGWEVVAEDGVLLDDDWPDEGACR